MIQTALRFVLAGAGNTLVTLIVYQVALFYMPPSPAYALSWIVGLVLVVTFYPRRIFRGDIVSARLRLALGASYVAVFALGLASLRILHGLGVQPRLSIIAVLVLTSALNFLFGKLLFPMRRPDQPPSPPHPS